MLTVLMLILVIGIIGTSYRNSARADAARIKAEEQLKKEQENNVKLQFHLEAVLKSSQNQMEASDRAYASLEKLAKSRKKENKRLRKEIDEMECLVDDLSDDDEEEDEEGKEVSSESEHVPVLSKGTETQEINSIAGISLALQQRIKHIRTELDRAKEEGRAPNVNLLKDLSDTSLDSLEKDM